MDDVLDDLVRIASRCERAARAFEEEPLRGARTRFIEASDSLAQAWSGSWLGYHAHVYTSDLHPRQPGEHFDSHRGAGPRLNVTTGDWSEFTFDAVEDEIFRRAGIGKLTLEEFTTAARAVEAVFDECKRELIPTLDAIIETHADATLKELRERGAKIESHYGRSEFARAKMPRQALTGDRRAMQGGFQVPHHIAFEAHLFERLSYGERVKELGAIVRHAVVYLQKRRKMKGNTVTRTDGPIFIGHGRSAAWRDLKDFIVERLGRDFEEFNREPVAGRSTKERLLEMLDRCCFAFLVMTAEDEHADGRVHARQNVVHEIGLFQGRYGFERAIVLLEEGCEEFSNLHGVGHIHYPRGNMKAAYEEIRRVLEREGIL